ncbi:hypothetical protein ESCO_006084 [Escovopsis weberi]|uniref:Uncharacterized protein n=1 Tax=Escovopsis weberi TaxID=150374 RepID=A0A0M8N5B5_ESCWE|nr:hypothetical protein ESCO_006084 [Escovopsis weberi]
MAGPSSSHESVTIVLSTLIPSLFLISVCGFAAYRLLRSRRARYPNRGITPICDEEIESWKIDKTKLIDNDEKPTELPVFAARGSHNSSMSVSSVRPKPPSLIIYHSSHTNRGSQGSGSDDQVSPWSPSIGKNSVEGLQTPILARAPNSRPGLTDDTIRGDEAFVTHSIKRHPSRLSRLSPTASPRHLRTKSARSSLGDFTRRELWLSQDLSRPSLDNLSARSMKSPRAGRRATFSTPVRIRHGSYDDEIPLSGLSPRPPITRAEVGLAIG